MTDETNPRAVIGGNFPPLGSQIAAEQGDFAAITTASLEERYAAQPDIVAGLLDRASAIPQTIDDQETKGLAATLVKLLRDTAKNLDAFHAREKQPYLRGGQAVDQFFFGLIDKLARRARANKPGAADILLARMTDYDNRVLAAEQAKRAREAAEALRQAQEAARTAAREAAQAETARQAAERARKPETALAKTAAAVAQEQAADAAQVAATVSTARAEEAHMATLSRPADIMRTRGDDGTLSTMGVEKYAEIVDRTQLDLAALAPYIPLAALQSALTQFAKATDYNTPMAGASIGRRNKSVVR